MVRWQKKICVLKIIRQKWEPVSEISIPLHEVSPQMVEPNIIADTIHPVSVIALAPDTFWWIWGKPDRMGGNPFPETRKITIGKNGILRSPH